MFCSGVVAFTAIFPSTRRERERRKINQGAAVFDEGFIRVRAGGRGEEGGVASRSILLSTVQYLYVHPIVLPWVVLPGKKKDSNLRGLSPEGTVRTQHTWTRQVGARGPAHLGGFPPSSLVCFLLLHTDPASEAFREFNTKPHAFTFRIYNPLQNKCRVYIYITLVKRCRFNIK